MTAEEKFAIEQTVNIIRMKVKEAFSHIRPDSRGDGIPGNLFSKCHK